VVDADPSAQTSERIAGAEVVGIVGAGTMGAGIAQVALAAGHGVRLHDVDPAAFERARTRIGDGLTKRAIRYGLTTDAAAASTEQTLERLRRAEDLKTLAAGAGLVIEAALEDLATKRGIFEVLDRATLPAAILATNTSAISVAAIGAGVGVGAQASRVIGLHFFNPAPRMALVEVVRTPSTDPAVIDRAIELMRTWGKTPVVCTDSPGFIVNRVNRPFTLEALSLLESGVASVPRIDRALHDAGFPMGPFELMDLIGIDINLAAARGLYTAMDRDPRFQPSPIQERLVAAGQLGRKTSQGFYRYDEDGRGIEPNPAVKGTDAPGFTDEAVVERVILAIVNEAFTALGDGVAGETDIDLALRLGAGHLLGPFERVAALGGRSAVARRLRELVPVAGPRFVPAAILADVR
jgi:3-hydroxybutyryl-CoA dehydrogenase